MDILLIYAVVLLGAVVLLAWCVALFLRRTPSSGGFRGYVRAVWDKWRAWVLAVAAFLLAVAVFLPVPASVRESDRRRACRSNLVEIAKAFQRYSQEHGCYPPAYVADKDGRPLYSWRVLLLPYLDYDVMYQDMHLDEPWDSPHNRRVSAARLHIYTCPSEYGGGAETSYVMIVGPGTISDGPNTVRMRDVKDGAANTIAVVEMCDSGIHWAEPRDLSAAEMSYRVNDPDHPCIRSRHTSGGGNAAFCDDSVHFLSDSVPAELIEALTTIAGGEDLKEFWENY